MKVAVVILNWNGEPLLRKFLPSIVKYSEGAEIYVADNASADGSLKLLKSEFPTVKIIRNKENFGFAKGYNEALKHVDADIFALVNSDIEVTENWLGPIISEFASNHETAIIQPKILDYKQKDRFEYAGGAGGFLDQYGFPFARGRIFESVEKDEGQYDDDIDIFWASGACFFIRSDVFRQLDGFDPDFFAHQEEIDLCWRAFNHGFKARYISSSKVYHVGGATLQIGNPHKTYLNFRNSLFMLAKNLPKQKLFRILIRLIIDGIAGIRFLLIGKPMHFFAVIRAHFAFYTQFNRCIQKRQKFPQANYYILKNIVAKHFLFRKNTYKSLF